MLSFFRNFQAIISTSDSVLRAQARSRVPSALGRVYLFVCRSRACGHRKRDLNSMKMTVCIRTRRRKFPMMLTDETVACCRTCRSPRPRAHTLDLDRRILRCSTIIWPMTLAAIDDERPRRESERGRKRE